MKKNLLSELQTHNRICTAPFEKVEMTQIKQMGERQGVAPKGVRAIEG